MHLISHSYPSSIPALFFPRCVQAGVFSTSSSPNGILQSLLSKKISSRLRRTVKRTLTFFLSVLILLDRAPDPSLRPKEEITYPFRPLTDMGGANKRSRASDLQPGNLDNKYYSSGYSKGKTDLFSLSFFLAAAEFTQATTFFSCFQSRPVRVLGCALPTNQMSRATEKQRKAEKETSFDTIPVLRLRRACLLECATEESED